MSFLNPTLEMNLLVGLGKIPGVTNHSFIGVNSSIGAAAQEDMWELGFKETAVASNATVFISSSNAGDTGDILLNYLDDDYKLQTATATLNGQNQVQIVTDFFRSDSMASILPASNTLLGDVYLAESDALTAGVPDTQSKIHSFIKFYDAPRNRSVNFSRDGRLTVPANHVYLPLNIDFSVGRNVDTIITNEIRLGPTSPWFTLAEFHRFESAQDKDVLGIFPLAAKTEVRFVVTAQNDNASAAMACQSWMIDLNLIEF